MSRTNIQGGAKVGVFKPSSIQSLLADIASTRKSRRSRRSRKSTDRKLKRREFYSTARAMATLHQTASSAEDDETSLSMFIDAGMIAEGSLDIRTSGATMGEIRSTPTSNGFHFLRLASETRLQIYEYLLAADKEVKFVKLPKRRCWKGISLESRCPEILRASKLIYNEAIVVLYGHNKFTFYAHQPMCRSLSPLRHIRRKHLDLITDITLKNWAPDFRFDDEGEKWTTGITSPDLPPPYLGRSQKFNPLVLWGLSHCTKLGILKIEMPVNIYCMAYRFIQQGGEIKNDWEPLRELFKVKGLQELHLSHSWAMPPEWLLVRSAREHVDNLLMTELLPRTQ